MITTARCTVLLYPCTICDDVPCSINPTGIEKDFSIPKEQQKQFVIKIKFII